jgi:hypothetical protein
MSLGSKIYLDNMGPLSTDLNGIGLELIRTEIINFQLPEEVRDKYAQVMAEKRETMAEIERLKLMKEQGVMDDYMKLKLLDGIANSGSPQMRLYTMQLLKNMNQDQSNIPAGNDRVIQEGGAGVSSLPGRTGAVASEPTMIKPPAGSQDAQVTMIRPGENIGAAKLCLVNMATESVHVLDKDVINIGRVATSQGGVTNDIVVNDQYASRCHLQLVIGKNEEVMAINVSSANPVTINDNKILKPGERSPVQVNDLIEIGYTKFKLTRS